LKFLIEIARKVYKSRSLIFLLAAVLLLELVAFFEFDRNLHLYFLDIGQGDSILIKTPDYRYILVDGGEGTAILEELGEVLPFWQRRVDLVVGTHADSDHIGGLVFVLEKYEVDRFITSDLEVEDGNLQKIKDIAEDREIELSELDSGDVVDVGELHLDVLWPDDGFEAENDNQNSVVLYGEYGNFSFLLTGDIEDDQEHALVSTFSPFHANILKISHHGSKTATSSEFIEAVEPDFAVISCGEDNTFGHPAPEVIQRIEERNIEILRTDLNGRIEFITDGVRLLKRLEK
jgi:competence protein ComEC